MGVEIERRFLVEHHRFRPESQGTRMVQAYLSTGDSATVRVRLARAEAWLTIKGRTRGLTRAEFEYAIPLADAEQLLELCDGGRIEKMRYRESYGRHMWDVDVFSGENEGLVLAEVELADESESFESPPWLGKEVTRDFRYSNSALARHPHREWRTE